MTATSAPAGTAEDYLRQQALAVIREAIMLADVSHAELAERLGITRAAVSILLNGEGNMKIGTLARFLQALGYRAEIFITEDEETDRD